MVYIIGILGESMATTEHSSEHWIWFTLCNCIDRCPEFLSSCEIQKWNMKLKKKKKN